MAFAPYHNGEIAHRDDLGRILGQFREHEFGHVFEYAERVDYRSGFAPDFDKVIFVGWAGSNSAGSIKRCAKVLKTVAYVAVDEADDGSPVVEKWQIKQHREYAA